jgi:hypothetical protein
MHFLFQHGGYNLPIGGLPKNIGQLTPPDSTDEALANETRQTNTTIPATFL